jgi:hypothetical protein
VGGGVSGDVVEADAPGDTVRYEVWRSHATGPDLLLYGNLSEEDGERILGVCIEDKATGYPDAPVDFYLVRAETTRTRLP